MATFQQKYESLKQEFNELDINDDGRLDKNEMFQVLDSKIGKQFDREIAEELWSNLDINHDGKVTVNEFIQILLKAEDSLKSKINNCRTTLELNYQQKRETETNLDYCQQNEKLNNFGVMEGSQLCVIVIQAANLKADGKQLDPFITLQFDKFEKQTTINKGPNPIWKETQKFYFPVQTGKEDLKLTVCDFDKYTPNIVIARVDLNLSNNGFNLKNQQLHDIWLDLYDINGNRSGSQLNIQIQWVYSKVKYLRDVLNSYQQQVNQQEQELLQYERDLFILYEPFVKWRQLNTKGYQKPITQEPASMIPISYQQADPTKIIKPFSDPLLDKNSKFKLITILIGFIACLTLLILFYKAQFFDLLLIIDFYILWEFNALNENRIKTLGILFGMSCFLDVVWIFCIGVKWLGNDSHEIFIPYEISIQKMISILVIISLIVRLYLILNLFQLSQELQNLTNPQTIKIQHKNIVKIDMQNTHNIESKTYLHNGRPIVIY
ncbi:unnamed protein product [Paramecium primaurelia]|uniref:C2 domain-containing protein n=1 Tax=Paramecium primaurelia TaxID=5886 RepID=A0A8S1P0E8_PARPR|nr:unnamed protein product [Paramecium primaurelia]